MVVVVSGKKMAKISVVKEVEKGEVGERRQERTECFEEFACVWSALYFCVNVKIWLSGQRTDTK